MKHMQGCTANRELTRNKRQVQWWWHGRLYLVSISTWEAGQRNGKQRLLEECQNWGVQGDLGRAWGGENFKSMPSDWRVVGARLRKGRKRGHEEAGGWGMDVLINVPLTHTEKTSYITGWLNTHTHSHINNWNKVWLNSNLPLPCRTAWSFPFCCSLVICFGLFIFFALLCFPCWQESTKLISWNWKGTGWLWFENQALGCGPSLRGRWIGGVKVRMAVSSLVWRPPFRLSFLS